MPTAEIRRECQENCANHITNIYLPSEEFPVSYVEPVRERRPKPETKQCTTYESRDDESLHFPFKLVNIHHKDYETEEQAQRVICPCIAFQQRNYGSKGLRKFSGLFKGILQYVGAAMEIRLNK